MNYAIAGCPTVGNSNNFLLRMQHHKSNILTSESFTPPPRKSLLDRLVEFLRSEGNP